MPKNKKLTLLEQGQIMAYKQEGLSSRKIAAKMCRSKTVINNFIKNAKITTKRIAEEDRVFYLLEMKEKLQALLENTGNHQ